MTLNIVILGGGGNISYWLEKVHLDKGGNVYSVSRGRDKLQRTHSKTENFHKVRLDINNKKADISKILDYRPDIIVDFICFNKEQALLRRPLLRSFSGVYIMVSTVAVYNRHEGMNIITDKSDVSNASWPYAVKKLEAERCLLEQISPADMRILRLGHTYDLIFPVPFGPSDWHIPNLLEQGHKLLTHAGSRSKWRLQHSSDCARKIAYIGNNTQLFSHVTNIVGFKEYSWLDICFSIFDALGRKPKIQFLTAELLERMNPYWSDSVKYHKRFDESYIGHSQEILFNNSGNDRALLDGLKSSVDLYRANRPNIKLDKITLNQYLQLIDESIEVFE